MEYQLHSVDIRHNAKIQARNDLHYCGICFRTTDNGCRLFDIVIRFQNDTEGDILPLCSMGKAYLLVCASSNHLKT